MKRQMWIKICLVLLLGFFAIGHGSVCAADKLVLQLPWHHQFQFAGYYMAEEQGYYRDAGLSVEIRDVTQGSNSVEEVLSGGADFGVSGSGLLVERSLGKPVVAIAAIFQQSPSVFLALESSGIRKPADLIGKKVMLEPNFKSLSLLVFLYQEKLLDKIERLETSFDYNSLLNGQTDVFNAYRSNEPYLLEDQGYATNIINPKDYGINFYGDTLFTSETFIQEHPEATESFRQASLRGWQYAIAHPDATIAVIQAKYKCQKTVAALQYEAAETIKLIQADQVEIGDMDLLRWGKINHHLIALGLISPDFYVSKHFLYDPPPGIPWEKLREGIIGIVLAFIFFVFAVLFIAKKNIQLKATQKNLLLTQKRLSEAQQLANMRSWELDLQTNILHWSDQVYKIFGIDPQQGLATYEAFLASIHPEDREDVNRTYLNSVKNKTPYNIEHRVLLEDETVKIVNEECRTFYAADGTPLRSIGTVQDITERKQGEESLRRYEQIILSTGDHMSFLDRSYVYREVNSACFESYHKSREEIVGFSVADLLGADIFEQLIKKKLDRCLAGEEIHYQSWFELPGRGRRYLDINYYPYTEADGSVSGVVVNSHDITDLKQAEEDISQLLQAIDQSSETIVITDIAGTIQYVNPAFEKISGYTRKEAIGQNPRILKSDQQDDAIYTELWKTLTEGEVWRGQLVNKKKEGTLYIEDVTIAPVFDSLGKVVNYIAVKRDITHEVGMEEQLRQKYKMEAIGVMAGGMAHNFNNNLSIILGNIELSQLKLPQESETVPLLKNAKIAVLRSRDLIQQILTYSRQGTFSKGSIQLSQAIDEALKLLSSTLPASINVRETVSLNSKDIAIDGDASQIQEVIINLCNNAVHAMDEKGDLTLTLDTVNLEKADITAQYQCQPGCYAKLTIQDNGSGMSAETVAKIFDLFFTTKGVDEGTGVGLSTVQGIVDHHGGMIKVNSVLGEGTTFELYFPIIDRRQKKRAAVVQELPRGNEKIVFLDDEEMLANVWSETLREYGYQVSTMMSSTETLKLFTANPDYFDLLITDQTMPELVGVDLIQELLKIRPDLATILCTGYSNKINEAEAKQQGISAFCMKPLDLPELLQTVRRVLDEGKK